MEACDIGPKQCEQNSASKQRCSECFEEAASKVKIIQGTTELGIHPVLLKIDTFSGFSSSVATMRVKCRSGVVNSSRAYLELRFINQVASRNDSWLQSFGPNTK
eukprot:gene16849-18549_t